MKQTGVFWTLSLYNEYTCILMYFKTLYEFDKPLHVKVTVTMFCLFCLFFLFSNYELILQISRMKTIIFILVAATMLSACDGCPLYLKNNRCQCSCNDAYSSCRNRCSGNGMWRIVCLNQCVKLYSSCSRNCPRSQG